MSLNFRKCYIYSHICSIFSDYMIYEREFRRSEETADNENILLNTSSSFSATTIFLGEGEGGGWCGHII